MPKQIIFFLVLLATLGIFTYSVYRYIRFFRLTKAGFPVKGFLRRTGIMFRVAIGQTKIFRFPFVGFMHAMVFWGFCVILFGSIEMIIDGLGGTEKALGSLGVFYNIMMGSGDVFALIIAISILGFVVRRVFLHIKRFEGIEMKHISHLDANIALGLIFFLMISLQGMNIAYIQQQNLAGKAVLGFYPLSGLFRGILAGYNIRTVGILYETCWWSHILVIFIFANYLPYSKHFHVFMSAPNVFLSRLDPLGKLTNMEEITREVKLMLDPDALASAPPANASTERFGVKDVEDVSWKNYFDSLACTECGRCTSVCPANITGKKLSPRKIMMDLRARMKEKGPLMVKHGRDYSDHRSLIREYISEEELWACTTCNACAGECPININQPTLIVDMRRYLVMEEASAPGQLKAMFSYIENNGAPWQFSQGDRMQWAKDLDPPVMANLFARGEKPEFLYWVGCSGAFDDRYRKVSRAFTKILSSLDVSYAVLGTEETCTGDPARRAGNEMLYQIQALQNIALFKSYGIKKILTTCPHCYNIFKNEYPDLGGHYEVINYLQFLDMMVSRGTLKLTDEVFGNDNITYHDPCYLGRANEIYEEPRKILKHLSSRYTEMRRNHSSSLCCGGGGGQMFKEAEPGNKEVYTERTEDVLLSGAGVVATACPFCMNMITDGIKYKNRETDVRNLDIAELIAVSLNL
ncbi:MAG: (Fe-S)-binding protein [Bacteroidetes bacterium]|nr:(Fe-S)-binding protein [Bacteroidota bacterium]